MGVSENRRPQYRPQNTMILVLGIPKEGPLILETRISEHSICVESSGHAAPEFVRPSGSQVVGMCRGVRE